MNVPKVSNSHNPNHCFPPLLSFLFADEPLYPGRTTSATPIVSDPQGCVHQQRCHGDAREAMALDD